MEAVRLGILGCGSWGEQYAKVLARMSQLEVAAVADLDQEKALAVAEYAPGARLYAAPEDLYQDGGIEAIILATPTPTHRELTCNALEAGKHVLVEKPMSLTLSEAQTMVETADKYQRVLMVGQIVRFITAMKEVRRILQRGDIGRPLHVVERRYGLFREQTWPDWWQSMEAFLLLHLGSHTVDAVLWLLEEQPQWAFAQGIARKVTSVHGAVDAFTLTIGLSHDVLVGIHHEAFGGSKELAQNLLVVGEEGRVEIDDFSRLRLNGEEIFREAEAPFPPALKAEVIEFAAAIREGRPPAVSGKDVLPTVASLDAARESMHSLQAERVQL